MKVDSITLTNFRSFEGPVTIPLAKLNVVIGGNNSGKSSILRALHLLQQNHHNYTRDFRHGTQRAEVGITLSNINHSGHFGRVISWKECTARIVVDQNGAPRNLNLVNGGGSSIQVPLSANEEPNHFIVPIYSGRTTAGYIESTRAQDVRDISPNFTKLAAKLSRLQNRSFPSHEYYWEACEQILGFHVTAVASNNGNMPGSYFPDRTEIHVDQMGEGVANIVGILAEIAVAEGKLFLIEEPENDLHPQALKALLNLIVAKSATNQFVISTHSHIVLKHLGAEENCNVIRVWAEDRMPPTCSRAKLVPNTPEARMKLLYELGYDLADFDLHEGWLIFEESSAERIISNYLIPWFAPKLLRLRTIAAGGTSKVEARFEDFHRMVCYAHLEQVYKEKTWVMVDGDETGMKVVERLKNSYHTWPDDRFIAFPKNDFEEFYPDFFAEEVNAVLSIADRDKKRVRKKELLLQVCKWVDEDRDRARVEFEKSAAEIISVLQSTEATL